MEAALCYFTKVQGSFQFNLDEKCSSHRSHLAVTHRSFSP